MGVGSVEGNSDSANAAETGVLDPLDVLALHRRALRWVIGSLALIVPTFFISGWRPLFGGSGFGLAIELISCAASIALALLAAATIVGYMRGHRVGLHNRVLVVSVMAVVAVAILLDILAFGVASLRL